MQRKLLIFFSLIFYSCSKKEGCIDITVVNYDISADIDDGSCVYNGCFDPLSVNYTPNPIPNSDLDTVCLSLNKTWIADSYIVNGVQYITAQLLLFMQLPHQLREVIRCLEHLI